MTQPIRWGIISTGVIADAFAHALSLIDDAELIAVGSRTQASADAFGEKWQVPRRYPSYEALAADPDLDVVYIGTPHPMHAPNTLLCLEHGKHVLVEKPFAMNAAESAQMIRRAREKSLFLMEAMWTRTLPAPRKARELMQAGAIGTVHLLQADFSVMLPFDPHNRLFAPELGGGALLDLGIYPLSFAAWMLGLPHNLRSFQRPAVTGVDESLSVIMQHHASAHVAEGALSVLSAGMQTHGPRTATLAGDAGRIVLHAPFHESQRLTLTRADGSSETFDLPVDGSGYRYEAEEVGRCIRMGLLESPVIPLDESLAIMGTLDSIRARWQIDTQ